mgnify:CR=1 FL=1
MVSEPTACRNPTSDAEHPMDITMSRVHSASDTCDIYFTYIKVNPLLYTCSLDTFEDGILLDPPLCMHRYCRSFTNVEEECKRQGTTTPSAREAWKRRRKKPEKSPGPGHPAPSPGLPAPGASSTAAAKHLQAPDILPSPEIQPEVRKSSTLYPESTEADPANPDIRTPNPDIWPAPSLRTSGPSRGHPDPIYLESVKAGPDSPDIRHLPRARTSGLPCLRTM